MGKYVAWYDRTETYKVWFEAGSLRQAQALLKQVNAGEMGVEELTDLHEALKGVEVLVALDSLEEVAE